jgi:hypothetical protein
VHPAQTKFPWQAPASTRTPMENTPISLTGFKPALPAPADGDCGPSGFLAAGAWSCRQTSAVSRGSPPPDEPAVTRRRVKSAPGKPAIQGQTFRPNIVCLTNPEGTAHESIANSVGHDRRDFSDRICDIRSGGGQGALASPRMRIRPLSRLQLRQCAVALDLYLSRRQLGSVLPLSSMVWADRGSERRPVAGAVVVD